MPLACLAAPDSSPLTGVQKGKQAPQPQTPRSGPRRRGALTQILRQAGPWWPASHEGTQSRPRHTRLLGRQLASTCCASPRGAVPDLSVFPFRVAAPFSAHPAGRDCCASEVQAHHTISRDAQPGVSSGVLTRPWNTARRGNVACRLSRSVVAARRLLGGPVPTARTAALRLDQPPQGPVAERPAALEGSPPGPTRTSEKTHPCMRSTSRFRQAVEVIGRLFPGRWRCSVLTCGRIGSAPPMRPCSLGPWTAGDGRSPTTASSFGVRKHTDSQHLRGKRRSSARATCS